MNVHQPLNRSQKGVASWPQANSNLWSQPSHAPRPALTLGLSSNRVHLNKEYFILEKDGIPDRRSQWTSTSLRTTFELQDPHGPPNIFARAIRNTWQRKSRPLEEFPCRTPAHRENGEAASTIVTPSFPMIATPALRSSSPGRCFASMPASTRLRIGRRRCSRMIRYNRAFAMRSET